MESSATQMIPDKHLLYEDKEAEITSIRIPKKMKKELKKLALKKGYTLSEYVLKAVDIQLRLELEHSSLN